ncbi:hypothetical protein [Sphingomonas sp.]|jgi:hypothetical protein|uniref:hypothetical protein n=1 Tax=Sphingomonas sp. TaxID=28214 RepID=UPI002E36A483|nr:hypothetical protein [Sphingomonas sp.]HEX4694641.1 hypothetical protein [Sphingomonas sp.]
MPLLLFPELTLQLWTTGRKLAPWARLVGIEQTLLRRVESAYLTWWFGRRVPEKNLNLLIAIRNIDALKDQYQLAKRSRPDPVSQVSLLGPLAGISGMLVGAAMSPTGLVLIASQFKRITGAITGTAWEDRSLIKKILWGIGGVFAFVLGLGLLPGLAIGVGMPLGLFAALGLGIAGHAQTRSIVTLLGDFGLFIDAMARFWDQLSGPRDKVANPLLKRILVTLDKFAGLFIQFVGVAAFLFDRLMPIVPGLLAQWRAMSMLIGTVMAALKAVLSGVLDALFAPFDQKPEIGDVLGGAMDQLLQLPGKIAERVRKAIADANDAITPVVANIKAALNEFADFLKFELAGAFGKTALGVLVERIKMLLDLVVAWKAAYKAIPEPPKGDDGPLRDKVDGWGPLIGAGLVDAEKPRAAVARLLGAVDALKFPDFPDLKIPDLPTLPTLPDLDALDKAHPRPDLPDIGALASHLFDQASEVYAGVKLPPEFSQRPKSAFAGARKALESSAAMPMLTLNNVALRDAIYLAVGRVLPPALRDYAPQVRGLFDKLDETIYGAPEQTPAQKDAQARQLLPVNDLGDTGLLLPKITKLSFVGADAETPDLRAFRDIVVAAFEKQSYAARAA